MGRMKNRSHIYFGELISHFLSYAKKKSETEYIVDFTEQALKNLYILHELL